ncbi:MAG: hypothetical protein J6X10_04525 [Bacteroidales bacterium]|nr:hypothetical protein [Bacteroidales bacterium]
MAKKTKKKSGSKKKTGNVFTTVIVVILVIILAFFVIYKFLISNNNNTDNQEVKPVVTTTEVKPVADVNVNGAWMSIYDQSTLIIKDGKYAIYLSGIERDHPIIGRYSVKGNEVTFVNKKDPCEGAKGLYEVSFKNKNIVFKCKDDGCSKRKSIFLHDWERLDTDISDITIE